MVYREQLSTQEGYSRVCISVGIWRSVSGGSNASSGPNDTSSPKNFCSILSSHVQECIRVILVPHPWRSALLSPSFRASAGISHRYPIRKSARNLDQFRVLPRVGRDRLRGVSTRLLCKGNLKLPYVCLSCCPATLPTVSVPEWQTRLSVVLLTLPTIAGSEGCTQQDLYVLDF